MKKYEYLVRNFNQYTAITESILNELGNDGWYLTHITKEGEYIFIREKVENSKVVLMEDD